MEFEVQESFIQELLTFNLAVNVVYPNTEYKPSINETFTYMNFLPQTEEKVESNSNRLDGRMEFVIVTGLNKGTDDIQNIEDILEQYMTNNKILLHNDVSVRITEMEEPASYSGESFYQMPVSFVFEAYKSN